MPAIDRPKRFKHRSAEETIRQHLALMQAGNVDEAMCDSADDAVVVLSPTSDPT